MTARRPATPSTDSTAGVRATSYAHGGLPRAADTPAVDPATLIDAAIVDLRDERRDCLLGHAASYGVHVGEGYVCDLHAYERPERAVSIHQIRPLERAYHIGDALIGKAWVIGPVIAAWSSITDRKRVWDSEDEAVTWLLGEVSGPTPSRYPATEAEAEAYVCHRCGGDGEINPDDYPCRACGGTGEART